ncbi:MAG: S9 family peptidase [Planctomycetota bacterium]
MSTTPPCATKKEHETMHHGITRNDPYAWMKDPRWQEVLRDPSLLEPEIRSYLEAENAYMEASLAGTKPLQEQLFAELKARIKEDDSSVPMPDGPWEYYRRFETGGQYPIYCRQARGGGAEEVLLDVNALAAGKEFCRVMQAEPSPDHKVLAYAVDENGSEICVIRFKDLATGELLPHTIEQASGDFEWANDGKTLFYSILDDNHRAKWVRRHTLGRDGDDPLVYEEPDDGFFTSIQKTESGRFLLISAHDHTTSEVHYLDADNITAPLRCIEERQPDVLYRVTHHGEQFFLLLREDNAKDGCIVTAPTANPGRAQWQEWLPHEAGRLLEDVLMFDSYMVRRETVNALPRIVVRDLSSGAEHEVAFEEAAYELGLVPCREFTTNTLRFAYSSMTTPQRVFDYDMQERSRDLRKEQEVPSGHNPADYKTERVFAKTHDGEEVPVTLLYSANTKPCRDTPLFLYGYGSYGYSMPASFATSRFSLVDRGFVFAIAHIRGGKERGYRWYEQGKRAHKENTFRDFIRCAEHLIETGYTGPGKVVANGGSAGGMLMGAIANMRPDLFHAIVAAVPFVDVLNTMLDKDLPLTPPEWPEWGNPIDSKEAYDTIAAYSPYDNVAAKDYPHMLVLAGLTDPRVTYWEPAKWVARLRERKTDDNRLLLKTNMGAGHAGASGRFDYLKETALMYAFVLECVALASAP